VSTVGAINVEIGADTTKLNDGIDKAKTKLDGFGEKTKDTSKEVDTLGTSLKTAAAAAIAFVGVDMAKSAILSADAFAQLSNRIKTATSSALDFQITFDALYQSAQSSGVALDGVVGSFQNIAGSAAELGASNAQVVQFVDTFNKLAKIGGASSEGIASALFQTSQALAGGVLRAEEFNSILEGTPSVARAIAESMGMTVGELRRAVNEGKVLSTDVFNGVLSKSKEVNAQLGAIPPSITASYQMLENSVSQFLSKLDEAGGITQKIGLYMRDWATVLDAVSYQFNKQKNARLEFGKIELDLQKEFEDQERRRDDAWFDAEMNKQVALGERAAIEREHHDKWTALMEAQKAKADEVAQKQLENIRKIAEEKARYQTAEYNEFEQELQKTEALKEEYARRVQAIAESHMSEQELLVAKHASELEILRQAREAEAMTEQEYRDLEFQAEADFQDKMYALQDQAYQARQRLAETERRNRVAVFGGMMDNLSMLMNTGSREMFEIGKVAALGSAIIKGYEAAVSSYAAGAKIGGPPLGAAFAATSVIATGAQIAAIQSQSFGSKSGGSPTIYSGGLPAVNTTQGGGMGGGSMQSGAMVNINLEGGDAAVFSGKQVRSLIDQINEAVGDGARIRLA
jgi:tape measure domain-containing protein